MALLDLVSELREPHHEAQYNIIVLSFQARPAFFATPGRPPIPTDANRRSNPLIPYPAFQVQVPYAQQLICLVRRSSHSELKKVLMPSAISPVSVSPSVRMITPQ
jgi:hypothetical protein